MAVITTRFGPFLPDIPVFGSAGSDLVKNVLPARGGFKPLRRVVPVTEAVGGDVLAAVFARSSAGSSFGFAAAKDRIELLDSDAFRNVSRSGGYSTLEANTWFFARFGDIVFATNYDNPIQNFDLVSDTAFSNVPIGAPQARFLAVVNRFLVALYINEEGDVSPTGVRWSSLGDPDSFPLIDTVTGSRSDEAVQTLSDRQVLATEYGDITGAATGLTSADAVIFQESSITAMNFTGSDTIFSFDVLEGARGCIAPNSIVSEGGRAFYLNDTGLFATDGITSQPIGASRVDDFIFEAVSTDRLQNVHGGIDVRGKYMYWSLPGFGDLTLIYNYDIDEFSFAEDLGVRLFVRSLTTAPTLEAVAAQFSGLDAMGLSLDDPQFSGSNIPVFSAILTDNRMGPFAGSPMPATIKTKETEPVEDGRAYMQFSRPLVDTDDCTVTPVTRETLQGQPLVQNASRVDSDGMARSRVTSRYWALQIDIDEGAEWTFCQGVQAVFETAGNRDPEDEVPAVTYPDFLLAATGLLLLDELGRPIMIPTGDEVDDLDDDGQVVVAPEEGTFIITSDGDTLVTSEGDAITT